MICNAHLDPVWLWDWEEGIAAALSTFRIAAKFCREYFYQKFGVVPRTAVNFDPFGHTRGLAQILKKEYDPDRNGIPGSSTAFYFSYVPIVGLVIAFKDFRYDKGLLGSDWIGFKNFEFFFRSNDAWVVLRNMIGLNFLFIAMTLIVSVMVALIMNEVRSRRVIKVVQTIMFFRISCHGFGNVMIAAQGVQRGIFITFRAEFRDGGTHDLFVCQFCFFFFSHKSPLRFITKNIRIAGML